MITVQKVTKIYKIPKRLDGKSAALRSLWQRAYDEKIAVNDISFDIGSGEIVGYIGPNGAGKSTTIKMLSGILTPTAGDILVDGLAPHQQRREHAKNIGVVFGQKTSLWWDVPVVDSFRLLKEMYEIPDETYQENLRVYMDMLEMGGFLNQPVRQLSLGQRVKADLAAALLHNPQTVFLDEPTIGVDAVAKERLRQFIRDINQIRGVTVLLTTHDMVDMQKLVNRVLVIDAGRIAYDGTIHRLREQYGRNRRLDVVFAEHSPHIDVPGLVQVAAAPYRRSYTFNQQEMSAEKALGLIMNQPFTIRDITIQEADIEEIIRNLYTAKGM